MIMTYGKHKGEEVSQLPTSYIHWLANQFIHGEPLSPLNQEIERQAEDENRAFIGKSCYCQRCNYDPSEYIGGGEWS
jgi:putative quorum-sensing-regulated virulence factor